MSYHFVMTQTENFGYEYTISLCNAIEKFTEKEESLNKKIFVYKGMNLRFALERALYFQYANSDSMLNIYTQWKTGSLMPKTEVRDPLEKKLISIMCNLGDAEIIISSPGIAGKARITMKLIGQKILALSRLGVISSVLRQSINKRIQNGVKADIIFFVINERFVRFMKPIFDTTPVKCLYATNDPKTEIYLENQKIPHVKISHFLYKITRCSQPDSLLKRFCLIEHCDILYDTLKRLHPKSVVLVEGNASPYEVVNRICKKIMSQSVCLQQGWSPIIHNGFRNMTYSKMLVWGEGFAKELAPYNPDQKFIVSGSFIVQKNDEPKKAKAAGEKIKLGFLPPMQTKILSREKLDEFMSLVPWAANEFKKAEIRISQHPTIKRSDDLEKIARYENVKFLSSQTHPLQEIIGGNDIVVSFYSTTILESLAADALPIIVNLTAMPHYFPNIHQQKAGIEVKSTEEAKSLLKDFVMHPEKILNFNAGMQKFREEYFAFDKETALKNIVKEICN